MDIDWIFVIKVFGGFSIAGAVVPICLMIRHILIAQIQRDKDRLVQLRLEPDGTRNLTIRGFSQEEQVRILNQLRRKPFMETVGNDDKPSIPKSLKS